MSNRQISASALHGLDPKNLQALARDIVLDSTDYDDIRATGLTALAQFGDDSTIADDQTLRQTVDRMKTQLSKASAECQPVS